MVEELEPDTNEKMRALCKKISVAHDLDAEIQEELYSHMEDKLLGYLSGEEALAEEDAFILVREHFGDPSALKGLLQDVHAFEAQVSLARRLAAAIIVTAGVTVACFYLTSAALQLWPAARGFGGFHASLAVVATITVVFPWLLLRYWQRRLDAGHTPWFLTWRPAYLVGSIAALLMLQSRMDITSLFDNSVLVMWSPSIWKLVVVVLYASPVLQCMVWLWWCDRPPRKATVVGSAASIWVIWAWSTSFASNIEHAFVQEWDSFSIAVNLVLTFCILMMYAFVAYVLYAITQRAATSFTRRRVEI